MVSLALLGIIAVVLLSSLGTASAITLSTDKHETARNLAETQMEYVKSQAYAISYEPAPIPGEYPGYTVTITTQPLQDSNIQKITVTVNHQGRWITKLEAYKVK